MDESPSMQAELRAARAELVEATQEMREATKELIDAKKSLGAKATRKASLASIAPADRFPGISSLRCSASHRCKAPKVLLDRVRKDETRLAKQAKVRPARAKGKQIGYRLDGIKEGSLAAGLGLKNGDIVERVQTTALTKAGLLKSILDRLAKAKNITAVVKRGSKRFTLRIDVT